MVYILKKIIQNHIPFLIYKTESDSLIKNVIFNKKPSGEFDIILAEYNITKEKLPNITAAELNQSEVEYTNLIGKNSAPELICIERQEYQYSLEHDLETGYSYVGHWNTVGFYCYWTSSGGGGNDEMGSGSSNGSSNGGGVLTGPVDSPHGGGGGNSNQPFPDTPCGRLQKGTSSNAYKQKFKNLNKLSSFTLPYETGFAQKMVNGALSYINLQTVGASSLKFPSGSLNFTHVHNIHMVIDEDGNEYDGGVKILSPADVGALITTCQTAAENAAINPTEAFGVMISNEGIFAITLLEPLSINEIGQFNSNLAAFEDKYRDQAGKIVQNPNLDAAGRKDALQKMLLLLLKKYGLENKVGLFEGEAQDNIDSYDINWTKKALNPANPDAALVETPC